MGECTVPDACWSCMQLQHASGTAFTLRLVDSQRGQLAAKHTQGA